MIENNKLLKAIIPSVAVKIAKRIQTLMALLSIDPPSALSLAGSAYNLVKRYPNLSSAEELALKYRADPSLPTTSLDLGCGDNPRNLFVAKQTFGVDIRSDLPNEIRQANLSTDPIPFGDNFFDFCTAFDVLEHIPRNSWGNGAGRLSFLELMNEVDRVLKPGGLFLHSTPAYPSKQAFQDPTHVNIITEDTMPSYFCEPLCWAKTLGYGFRGNFELVKQGWVADIWLVGLMRKLG